MQLFFIGDFFRRRRKRQTDDWPAQPLLQMLIFWILFGLGALVGAFSIVAAMTGRWALAIGGFVLSGAALVGAVTSWRRLNQID